MVAPRSSHSCRKKSKSLILATTSRSTVISSSNKTCEKHIDWVKIKLQLGTGVFFYLRIFCYILNHDTHLIRQQKSHADLHPSPLSIRHGIEALVEVDVEHLNETHSSGRIYSLDTKDHLSSADVTLSLVEIETGASYFFIGCITFDP